MSSQMNVFQTSVANLAVTAILRPLSDWLRSAKGVSVSVEELAEALNISTPKATSSVSVPVQNPMFNLPSHLAGTGASLSRGGTCVYKPRKGKDAGRECGKPAIPGDEYCKTCVKKATVKKARESSVVSKPPVLSALPASLNPSSQPPIFQFSGVTKVDTPVDNVASSQSLLVRLRAEPVEGKENHYYLPEHHFIIRKEPNETFVVLGSGETEVDRELSEMEKQKAYTLGLRTLESSSPEQQKVSLPSLGSMGSSALGAPPSNLSLPTNLGIPSNLGSPLTLGLPGNLSSPLNLGVPMGLGGNSNGSLSSSLAGLSLGGAPPINIPFPNKSLENGDM